MTKKNYFIAILYIIFVSYHVHASEDSKTVGLIDKYLAGIKTIQTNFVQQDSSNGSTRSGYAYISKPNKIRVEYYNPEQELIILNSDLIMHYNVDLKEANYLNRENFVLDVLSTKDFKIASQTEVKKVTTSGNFANIEFTVLKDKSNRLISLSFKTNPIELKAIRIQQGGDNDSCVDVKFTNLLVNQPIDEYLFNFNNRKIIE